MSKSKSSLERKRLAAIELSQMVLERHLPANLDPVTAHIKTIHNALLQSDQETMSAVVQSAKMLVKAAGGLSRENLERFKELGQVVDGKRYYMLVKGFSGFGAGTHLELIQQCITELFNEGEGHACGDNEIPQQFFNEFEVDQKMATLYAVRYVALCQKHLSASVGSGLTSLELHGMSEVKTDNTSLLVSVTKHDMALLLAQAGKTRPYPALEMTEHINAIDDLSADIQELVFDCKDQGKQKSLISAILEDGGQDERPTDISSEIEAFGLVFDALIDPANDLSMIQSDPEYIPKIKDLLLNTMSDRAKDILEHFERRSGDELCKSLAYEQDLKFH